MQDSPAVPAKVRCNSILRENLRLHKTSHTSVHSIITHDSQEVAARPTAQHPMDSSECCATVRALECHSASESTQALTRATTRTTLETLCSVKEARHWRPKIVRSHSCETSKKASAWTESKTPVAGLCGEVLGRLGGAGRGRQGD